MPDMSCGQQITGYSCQLLTADFYFCYTYFYKAFFYAV